MVGPAPPLIDGPTPYSSTTPSAWVAPLPTPSLPTYGLKSGSGKALSLDLLHYAQQS